MIRTTEKTVIFSQPFFINSLEEPFPAGDYLVETDEELLEGFPFRAYRRILTVMQLPAESGHPGATHSFTVDPDELDAALKRDREIGAAWEDREFVQVSKPEVVESRRETTDRTAVERSRTRAKNRVISGEAANKLSSLPIMVRSAR